MIELVPETYFAPLDLLATFGREAPLQVDLGCGDGLFLCELASQNPDRNFLGIEKLALRVAKACRKSAHLENVRVLKVESAYAVRYLLPEASVETFYLLFPDPWPKRRHQRRRIVKPHFLDSIHRALEANGVLHIATDQLDYFQQIERLVAADGRFVDCSAAPEPWRRRVHAEDANLPATKFERRFSDAGAEIYRLALRKVSPVI